MAPDVQAGGGQCQQSMKGVIGIRAGQFSGRCGILVTGPDARERGSALFFQFQADFVDGCFRAILFGLLLAHGHGRLDDARACGADGSQNRTPKIGH